jgi:DNA-binding Lrp family transcriptional regulator
MMTASRPESVTTDAVDHHIIHAIQTFGRAPFALIADVIGVSEQTVARRYRRMESSGLLRVIGLGTPEALDVEQWLLRIQCRPDAASALADALARRADVSWVSLSAGGSEVVCSSVTRRGRQGQDLLLYRLPRTAQVQGLSAHSILHHFMSGPEWSGYGDLLSEAQVARLSAAVVAGWRDSGGRDGDGPDHEWSDRGAAGDADDGTGPEPATGSATGSAMLTAADDGLMTALRRDGRASLRRLADETGWSPARVGRRIDQLHAARALYFDVDLDLERLGFTSMSYIWVTVAPRDLEAVGRALNAHAEVAFCAAVTGSANIVLAVVCRDSADLYRYVTTKIGALEAVRQIETSPVLRRVKQAGTILTDTGLVRSPPT